MMQSNQPYSLSAVTPASFIERLHNAWQTSNSLLCVGLDPDPARFPAPFTHQANKIFDFCRAIVDATAPYACSFKPQIAYFAAHAAEDQLLDLIAYIKTAYPNLPVILDAKRGDIGSTAVQYAREAFERFNADAVTVNPYMGFDSVSPYLAYPERGVIVLCRTSNPGGSDLQNLTVHTENGAHKLYQEVATQVAQYWNKHQQCALVVGATFTAELAEVRRIVGNQMPLLVPGIGEQGGDIAATLQAGCNTVGTGLMINAARAILYASSDANWLQAAAQAAQTLKEEINRLRTISP